MKQNLLSYTLCLLIGNFGQSSYATQLVLGPATKTTPGFTFSQTVTQMVYSPGAATVYVGLTAADSGTAIYCAKRQ